MRTALRSLTLPAILALALITPDALQAQDAVELVNPSFEQDEDGNEPCVRVTDFGLVPGWNTATPPVDSGVSDNENATDGVCAAWMASFDPAIYQLTGRTIEAGEVYTLEVDARSSWQTTLFDAYLFYVADDGSQVPVATTTWDFEGISEPMITLTVEFSADEVPASIGQELGVAVKNTTPDDPNVTTDNAWAEVDNFRLTVSTSTAAEREEVPGAFTLDQNYPNPFNPATTIGYELKSAGTVFLAVFDVLGRPVRTLVLAGQAPGTYTVSWDGQRADGTVAPSGVYMYSLTHTAAGASTTIARTMLLLR